MYYFSTEIDVRHKKYIIKKLRLITFKCSQVPKWYREGMHKRCVLPFELFKILESVKVVFRPSPVIGELRSRKLSSVVTSEKWCQIGKSKNNFHGDNFNSASIMRTPDFIEVFLLRKCDFWHVTSPPEKIEKVNGTIVFPTSTHFEMCAWWLWKAHS